MFNFNTVLNTFVVCATTVTGLGFATPGHGQSVNTSQVLIGHQRCDHVIHQIMLHGVNSSKSAATTMIGTTPSGFASIPTTEIGDLQIMSVQRCSDGPATCGPRFKVVVMNQSQRRVDGVDVTLVGLLGAIRPWSPNATVRSCAIEPGAATEVQVELPIEARSMGNSNGVVIELQRLVIAIDSHDEWMETNEANNVQALAASAIPVVEQVIVSDATDVPHGQPLPDDTTSAVVPQSVEVQSTQPAKPAEVDELRDAMEKLGAGFQEVAKNQL